MYASPASRLGVERIELLLEALLRGLSACRSRIGCGIPFAGSFEPLAGASRERYFLPLEPPSPGANLKKRKPFHLVPVTSRAIALRDR